MSFELGNNIVSNGVTLEQLQAKCKTEKEKKSVESIFNKFDKNSDGTLQEQEQVEFMNFYHSADASGNDNGKIGRREMRHAKKEAGLTDLKTKDLRRFMEAYNATVEESQAGMELTYNNDGSVEASRTDGNGSSERSTYQSDGTNGLVRTQKEKSIVHQDGSIHVESYDQDDNATITKIKIGNNELTLNENGNYVDSNGGEYVLWDGNLRSAKDPSGRVLREQTEDESRFEYTYDNQDQQSTVPKTIKHTDSEGQTVRYDLSADGKTYTSVFGSFTFDPQTHTFTEVEVEPTPTPKTYERTGEAKNKTQGLHVNYDATTRGDWKKANISSHEQLKDVDTSSFVTAEQVMDSFLDTLGIETPINTDKLKADLIKYNPSVFDPNTGDVWANANWSKLDFPKDLKNYYLNPEQ